MTNQGSLPPELPRTPQEPPLQGPEGAGAPAWPLQPGSTPAAPFATTWPASPGKTPEHSPVITSPPTVEPPAISTAPGELSNVATELSNTPTPIHPSEGPPTPIAVGKAAMLPAMAQPLHEGNRPILVDASAATEIQEKSEEDEADFELRSLLRTAPPWLVSLVLHMVFLLILALLFIPRWREPLVVLEATFSDNLGEQIFDNSLSFSTEDPLPIEEPELSLPETLPVEDPFATPLAVSDDLIGFAPSTDLTSPTIGMALQGRNEGSKQALLVAYGGSALTEQAVQQALAWLSRQQQPNGSWSLVGPYPGSGAHENEISATAMALLAFQGAGQTHQAGTHKQTIAKGWEFLADQIDDDGNFWHGSQQNPRLYSQAQATIAICELYGMTKDPAFREKAQLAIDYAVRIQANEGGWRYYPGSGSDTSVTGWFVMALQSARMAGLEVPSPALEKISGYLDSVQHQRGSQYAYTTRAGATLPMTAEALLCRQYLGWQHEDERLARGARILAENPISARSKNVYYWYYATQVLHHMNGEMWYEWNDVMKEYLINQQETQGSQRGSWSPSGDRWGSHGGRLYVTCLSTYMLEVYYRHLPIYSRMYGS